MGGEVGFVRELNGIQANADRGLDGVVPAGLDVDRLPKALGPVETMTLRPVGDLRIRLEPLLLGFEGLERRLEGGDIACRFLEACVRRAPLFLEGRQALLR